jgi:hypothetical protein
VDRDARTLLDCPDGPFDFANVIFGGSDVQSRGKYIVADASEFHVSVKVGDVETSGLVKSHDGSRFS